MRLGGAHGLHNALTVRVDGAHCYVEVALFLPSHPTTFGGKIRSSVGIQIHIDNKSAHTEPCSAVAVARASGWCRVVVDIIRIVKGRIGEEIPRGRR